MDGGPGDVATAASTGAGSSRRSHGRAAVRTLRGFAWLGPPASLPVAFLPLLLLGLERARAASATGRRGGWRIIAAAVALSLVAGFLEAAYLDGLLALFWALCRLAELPGRRADYARRVALGGTAGLLLAAPALWPFVDLLRHAELGSRTATDMSQVYLPREALAQLLVPYALGPITGLPSEHETAQQMMLWARVASYAGVTLALAALLGAAGPGRHQALRWTLCTWIAVVIGRVTGAPVLAHFFDAVPFASSVQVYRYSGAAWLLPCCVLAAFVVDRAPSSRLVWPGAGVVAFAAAAGMAAGWPLARALHGGSLYFVASAAWAACSLAAFAWAAARRGGAAIAFVLVADTSVLFVGHRSLRALGTPIGRSRDQVPASEPGRAAIHHGRTVLGQLRCDVRRRFDQLQLPARAGRLGQLRRSPSPSQGQPRAIHGTGS